MSHLGVLGMILASTYILNTYEWTISASFINHKRSMWKLSCKRGKSKVPESEITQREPMAVLVSRCQSTTHPLFFVTGDELCHMSATAVPDSVSYLLQQNVHWIHMWIIYSHVMIYSEHDNVCFQWDSVSNRNSRLMGHTAVKQIIVINSCICDCNVADVIPKL